MTRSRKDQAADRGDRASTTSRRATAPVHSGCPRRTLFPGSTNSERERGMLTRSSPPSSIARSTAHSRFISRTEYTSPPAGASRAAIRGSVPRNSASNARMRPSISNASFSASSGMTSRRYHPCRASAGPSSGIKWCAVTNRGSIIANTVLRPRCPSRPGRPASVDP